MALIAWSDFVDLVKQHTPVEADRENVAVGVSAGKKSLYELYVRGGYANLMRYVPYYQIENVTEYQEVDVVKEGLASKLALPEASKIRFAKVQFQLNNSTSQANPFPWDKRQSLIDGANRGTGRNFLKPTKPLIAVSPHNDFAYIYPALQEGVELAIIWDGVRKSFKDTDQIRVIEDGEEEAEAVSYYVLNKLYRQVDEVGIADRNWVDYKIKRRELKVETRRMYNEIQRV
jgi:hypothetical protein